MATFVLTGAAGFVGKALTAHLRSAGHEVVALSRNPNPPAGEIYFPLERWEVYLPLVPSQADYLIHLAWAGSGGSDRLNTELQLSNALLTEKAVGLAARLGARFIGVGTITEDELDRTVFTPGVTPSGGYLYGAAKRTSREVSRFRAAQAGIEHIWVKLGNTYGLEDTSGRFLTSTLSKMVHGGELSFSAGTQLYDFLYLDDAAKGFEAIALKGKPGAIYYLGSGEARPLRQFIETMAEVSETQEALNFGTAGMGAVSLPKESFSIQTLQTDTEWAPEVPFSEGVRRLVEEARAQA